MQNGGLVNQLLCYDCRMYYKKYGELPRIPNAKSEPIKSGICEFINELDRLESENALELLNENLRKTKAEEELIKNTEIKIEAKSIPVEQTKNTESPSKEIEAKSDIIKTEQPQETTMNTTETEDEEEELGEVKSSKQTKPRDLEKPIINKDNQTAANLKTEPGSSFVPVSKNQSIQPQQGDVVNKLNLSSSSPKPAFSPLNFLTSPAPSQSPIPSFNPL